MAYILKREEEDDEDTSTAAGLLKALRRLLYPFSDDELHRRAGLARAALAAEDGGEELANEFSDEDDPLDAFVRELADQCSTAMAAVQGGPDIRYLAGALPIPSLDAWVLQTVSMEPILVMSHGLLGFCNLLSKAVVTLFPCREDEDGFVFDLNPEDSPEFRTDQFKAAERLGDLLAATVSYGNPHLAEPYLLQGPRGQLAAILCGSMEHFLMARLVCLAGGEFLPCVPCREWTSKLGAHVTRAVPGIDDIVRADVLAFFATEALMREQGVSRELGVWGVDLILGGLQMVETSRRAAGFPVNDDELSFSDRRGTLRALLRKREGTMEGISEILHLWDRSSKLVADLNPLLEPHIERHERRIEAMMGELSQDQTR